MKAQHDFGSACSSSRLANAKTLVEAGFDPQYSITGHVVYGTTAGLSAVPFSLDRLEVTGAPVESARRRGGRRADRRCQLQLSTTGALVFIPQRPAARRTLAWMDRSGKATPLAIEPKTFETPRLSPDGQQLAVVVVDSIGRTSGCITSEIRHPRQ
jgi:hypothetical protein